MILFVGIVFIVIVVAVVVSAVSSVISAVAAEEDIEDGIQEITIHEGRHLSAFCLYTGHERKWIKNTP